MNQNLENAVTIFPTLSTGLFTITSDVVGNKFYVVNTLGQHIADGIITSRIQNLDLTNEKTGTYMVVVNGENARMLKTLIKR